MQPPRREHTLAGWLGNDRSKVQSFPAPRSPTLFPPLLLTGEAGVTPCVMEGPL